LTIRLPLSGGKGNWKKYFPNSSVMVLVSLLKNGGGGSYPQSGSKKTLAP